MTALIWPVVGGRITQHYVGNWRSYQPQSFVGHMGTDIGAPADTPIFAAAQGIVQHVDYDPPGWGHYIRILYPEYGFHGFYAHMIRRSPLSIGDAVVQGQVVGNIGTTGHSTGNHLHYSVRLADPDPNVPGEWDPDIHDPYAGTAVNPRGYVDPMLFHDWMNQIVGRWTNGGYPGDLGGRVSRLENQVQHIAAGLVTAGDV